MPFYEVTEKLSICREMDVLNEHILKKTSLILQKCAL